MILFLIVAGVFAAPHHRNYRTRGRSNSHRFKRNVEECHSDCHNQYQWREIEIEEYKEKNDEAADGGELSGKEKAEKEKKKEEDAKDPSKNIEAAKKEKDQCIKKCSGFWKNLGYGVRGKVSERAEQLVVKKVDDGLNSIFTVITKGINKAVGAVKSLFYKNAMDFQFKIRPHAIVLRNDVPFLTVEYKGFEVRHGKQYGLRNFNNKDALTEETVKANETLAVRFSNQNMSAQGVAGTAIFQYRDTELEINKTLFVDIEHINGGTKCCVYSTAYVNQFNEEAAEERECANDQKKFIDHASVAILKKNKISEFSSETGERCKDEDSCTEIRYCTINFFTREQAAKRMKLGIPEEEVTKFFVEGNYSEDAQKDGKDDDAIRRPEEAGSYENDDDSDEDEYETEDEDYYKNYQYR